jgi:hypothetical protein
MTNRGMIYIGSQLYTSDSMAQDAVTLAYITAAAPGLSILALYLFIHIARQLKNDIILTQPRDIPEDSPPAHLPLSILGRSCRIADEKVDELWSVLKAEVWDGQGMHIYLSQLPVTLRVLRLQSKLWRHCDVIVVKEGVKE